MTITNCEIKRSTVDPSVMLVNVQYDNVPDWELLFTYFPNEIRFDKEELIGMTDKDALDLRLERDLEYLRS